MSKPTKKSFAVIFDMNGVVVDDEQYHYRAWVIFCERHMIKFNNKIFHTKFFGSTNRKVLPKIFGKALSVAELDKFENEKESIYRRIYRPNMKPVRGLLKFLKELSKNKIKIALATNSAEQNIRFALRGTKTQKYFKTIVSGALLKKAKPHPQIYLQAAKKLKIDPKDCVAFEDSLRGIESAQRAQMKVVGVSTSHSARKLNHTDIVIKDFSKLTLEKLEQLF